MVVAYGVCATVEKLVWVVFFFFLCCVSNTKKKLSQGGEHSEATSAFEMVPSMVQVFLYFIWIVLVLVVLGLFFSKDILGDAPRIPSEPPRRAFKGEGSLTFTSPLKIPLCGRGFS